jgi:hypothetical protein
MAEETPSRMTVYRILDDDEVAMDLTPIVLRDENNITTDEDYSRRMSFRNRHSSTLQAIEHDDDSHYMHFTFSQEPAELNGLNYLNLLVMMIHLFVSCGIQMLGLDGIMATHMQVSKKYETLITPAEWSQYIWAPILAAETVFSLAQLLPSFRSRPIIQDATGFFFFYSCLLQTSWVIVYSFHLFIPSFILVVATFVSLTLLLLRQHFAHTPKSKAEYWLFRFPFFLHCGWMAIMVAVNASMLCRSETSSVSTQLSIDVVALALLLPLATFLLWVHAATDYCIPSVIIYSYIGIAWRLQHPSDSLVNEYGETLIHMVRLTCYIFAGVVTGLMLPRMLISIGHRFLTIQVITMQEDSLTLE